MGEKGGDVPRETQFLLVESKGAAGDEATAAYVVFLPLVEGAFRASLQGGAGDALELCVESGDADTCAASFENGLIACMSHNTDALYWYAMAGGRWDGPLVTCTRPSKCRTHALHGFSAP